MAVRPCAHCGASIEGRRADALYCTQACSEAASRRRRRPKGTGRTARCGTRSGYHGHLRRGETACDECRAAEREHGEAMRRAAGVKPLTPRAKPRPLILTACVECGQEIDRPGYGRTYCSIQCRKAAGVRLEYERYGWTQRRANNQRRRARVAEATVETFVDSEIFERDLWVCGLCGGPVDKSLAHPHPMSKSLDHILPLSRGGAHSRQNVQLAHLTCNMHKGARVAA